MKNYNFKKIIILVMGLMCFVACDKKVSREEAQIKVFMKKANPETFKGYILLKNNLDLKDSIEKWDTGKASVKFRLVGAYSQYVSNYEYVVFELKNFSNGDYFIAIANSVRINPLFVQRGSLNNWTFANAKGLRRSKGDIKIVPLLKGESIFLLCDFHVIDGIYSQFRYNVEPKKINEVAFFQKAKNKYGDKLLLGPFETSEIDNIKEKFKGTNWAGPNVFNFENIVNLENNMNSL